MLFVVDAEFRNTGLERSGKLAKDLEWFKEQGYAIPEPSSPGVRYAQYLKQLSEKDPQAFLCHFYNVYFAHSAGGRMIGKKVINIFCELLLRYTVFSLSLSLKSETHMLVAAVNWCWCPLICNPNNIGISPKFSGVSFPLIGLCCAEWST